jgi:hypothetical protein
VFWQQASERATAALRTAALALGAAVWFGVFFVLEKHVPLLARGNPLTDAPYDTMGTFAPPLAALLAFFGVVRALWLAPRAAASAREAVRPAFAAALLLVVAGLGDAIAMLRHSADWGASLGWDVLAALLALTLAVVFIVASRVARGARGFEAEAQRGPVVPAAFGVVAAAAVLATYPVSWTGTLIGAVLTILVGAACLFVPTATLVAWLLPRAAAAYGPPVSRPHWGTAAALGLVLGVAFGAINLLGEGPPPPAGAFVLLMALYVGLTVATVCLGYAVLRGPVALP